MRRLGKLARRWAAPLSWIVCSTTAAAAPVDPTDLWWNPSESGWGMYVMRGGDTLFATLAVYDVASRGTFYTTALSLGGTTWSGDLYESRGPYVGATRYDPSLVTLRKVGTLAFQQDSANAGTLDYSVDGIGVRKGVERFLLAYDDYTGTYPVSVQRVVARCSDSAANGDRTTLESFAITHRQTTIALKWTSATRTCDFAGAFAQAGRLGSAQGSYACSDGESGDFAFSELTRHDNFIAGRFQGHGITDGCDYRGKFSGFVPD